MNKKTLNFNKQLLMGEIGAATCAPLVSYIFSLFTQKPNIISASAVGGAIFGASFFWLATRIHDKKKEKTFSASSLASDIAYFTPAAFLLTLLLYYPTLYLLSHYLLLQGDKVLLSVIPSQIIAFLLFLIGINLYRLFLFRFSGKKL